MTTVKYFSDHRKHTYKLADEQKKKQPNNIFIDKELAIKVIKNCGKAAHKFRIKSGFKQYDVILTKEQSLLTKIKK